MPKDPKRNIQSYQIEGGHLNEFEFQKSQGEMTEEAELPFAGKANQPKPVERVAEVTAKLTGKWRSERAAESQSREAKH